MLPNVNVKNLLWTLTTVILPGAALGAQVWRRWKLRVNGQRVMETLPFTVKGRTTGIGAWSRELSPEERLLLPTLTVRSVEDLPEGLQKGLIGFLPI